MASAERNTMPHNLKNELPHDIIMYETANQIDLLINGRCRNTVYNSKWMTKPLHLFCKRAGYISLKGYPAVMNVPAHIFLRCPPSGQTKKKEKSFSSDLNTWLS